MLSVVLILLVSLVILFYKIQQPEKFTNLLNRFKIIEQGKVSSYEAFQEDKSINRDAKGEAGILMKSVVDKIFTCSGFAIKTKSELVSDIMKQYNPNVLANGLTKYCLLLSVFMLSLLY